MDRDAAAPVGRDAELAEIAAFLGAAGGRAGAQLLSGEAGAGKTTLLRWTLAEARRLGRTVLLARPGESEAQLAFAGLVDLFEPVGDEVLDRLPPPQRRALAVALRRAEGGTEADALTLSQAVLGVLRSLARDAPVLVALDDAQWLDAPTTRVLEFALRRLDAEPVAVLAAVRGSDELAAISTSALRAVPAERLGRLVVGPLGVDAVGRLIGERLGRVPNRSVAARIRDLSGGNPFYALEIGRSWVAAAARDPAASPAVPESLAGLVRDRLDALSPAAREAVLVAAAALQPTRRIVAAVIGDAAARDGLAEAGSAGVLDEADGRLAFSHPLLAWAAYAGAAAADRLSAHERLAAAVAQPDERVRHLATITERPDASVAAELDAAAVRARDRGAPETAAELVLEARRLTPHDDPAAVRSRTLAAAELMIRAGNPVRARVLLERHVAATPPGPARAAALALLADIRSGYDWEAKAAMLEAALDEAAPGSSSRAELLVGLGVAHWALVRDLPAGIARIRDGLACAEEAGDPAMVMRALASLGFVGAFAGMGEDPLTVLERAIELEPRAPEVRLLFRPSYVRGVVLEWQGRLEESRDVLRALAEQVEEIGDSDTRPLILLDLSITELRLGNVAEAARLQDEGELAADLLGHDSSRAMAASYRARLEAQRGNAERARDAAAAGIELSARCHAHWSEDYCRVALAEAALSLGDHRAAAEAIDPAADRLEAAGVDHSPPLPTVPLAAEAAALGGDLVRAGRLLDRMGAAADRRDHAPTRRAWHRVRALVAAASGDLGAALEAAEASLGEAARVAEPLETARCRLVHAEVLRRLRRRAAAREAAGVALATFEALGARTWVERARSELARAGAPVATDDGRVTLTPTQREVAERVVAGQTNREVAEALFMSPHTVEAHLTTIYRALGIRGRTDLARVLGPGAPPAGDRGMDDPED